MTVDLQCSRSFYLENLNFSEAQNLNWFKHNWDAIFSLSVILKISKAIFLRSKATDPFEFIDKFK